MDYPDTAAIHSPTFKNYRCIGNIQGWRDPLLLPPKFRFLSPKQHGVTDYLAAIDKDVTELRDLRSSL